MHTASGIDEAQGSSKGKGKAAGGNPAGDLFHCAKLQGVILGVGEFSFCLPQTLKYSADYSAPSPLPLQV